MAVYLHVVMVHSTALANDIMSFYRLLFSQVGLRVAVIDYHTVNVWLIGIDYNCYIIVIDTFDLQLCLCLCHFIYLPTEQHNCN